MSLKAKENAKVDKGKRSININNMKCNAKNKGIKVNGKKLNDKKIKVQEIKLH